MAAFVRELVHFTLEYGQLSGDHHDGAIVFRVGEEGPVSCPIPDARYGVRRICADLASWARQDGGGDVNPYGAYAEIRVIWDTGIIANVYLDFMNTPDEQWFRLRADEVRESR